MPVYQQNRNFNLAQPLLLPLARYRLFFEFAESGNLPDYLGSAWRGSLGHALKKTVCVTSLSSCQPCSLFRSCPYPYLFETPPPLTARKMRKYTSAPHPFLLEFPWNQVNSPLLMGLTLIGRGSDYLAYLIHALQRAGEGGLGKHRTPMKLIAVQQSDLSPSDNWVSIYRPDGTLETNPPAVPEIPPVPATVRLRIETPLRLQRKEQLVSPERFCFSDLFGSLLRRVSMLTYFHTETPLETDFAGLMERAHQFETITAKLTWQDWTRYSSRQMKPIRMGGVMGEILIDLSGGPEFWPYLWIGQWIHAGKGTSMGLGCYTIWPAGKLAETE